MRAGSHELVGASGRRYVLRFGANAIAQAQDALGESFDKILGRVLIRRGRVDVKTLRVLVQMALERARRPSVQVAGDVLDDIGIQAVVGVLSEVFAKKEAAPRWREDFRRLRVHAAIAGVDVGQFWDCTMEDLSIAQDATAEKMTALYKLGMWVAWHVEAFARTKYLPDLGPLLDRIGAEKPVTKEPTTLERHFDMTMQKIRMQQLAERSQKKHRKN